MPHAGSLSGVPVTAFTSFPRSSLSTWPPSKLVQNRTWGQSGCERAQPGSQDHVQAIGLDEAISAYTRGFEADPRDHYPGVNAVNLLIQKGTSDALKDAERLLPLVSFAVARRGGMNSSDYWDVATVVELACLGGDWPTAGRAMPKVLVRGTKAWMLRTTRDNIVLVRKAFGKTGRSVAELDEIIDHFEARLMQLERNEKAITDSQTGQQARNIS
jgi:MAP3K TRAFs-binding domain